MTEQSHPNLFIIGACKSGTTSLHEYMGTHPDIFMSTPKEPSFFVDPPGFSPEWNRQVSRYRDLDAYLELFVGARGRRYVGESSTNYTKAPLVGDAARQIWEFQPNAKLIYIMRDPIERIVSHYWHRVRRGLETRTLLPAVKHNPLYLSTSNYPLQLRNYLKYFAREQLFVLTLEELTEDPCGTVQQIFRWLGIATDFVPPNIGHRANAAPPEVSRVGLIYSLCYSQFWKALGPLVPSFLRSNARRLMLRSKQRKTFSTEPLRIELRERITAQIRELESLLGREFPYWYRSDKSPAVTCLGQALYARSKY